MDVLVAKLLAMLGLLGLVLAGVLLPVRLLQISSASAHRYRKCLSLCNAFAGGVFLATCFNALLPAVREKVSLSRAPSVGLLPAGWPRLPSA